MGTSGGDITDEDRRLLDVSEYAENLFLNEPGFLLLLLLLLFVLLSSSSPPSSSFHPSKQPIHVLSVKNHVTAILIHVVPQRHHLLKEPDHISAAPPTGSKEVAFTDLCLISPAADNACLKAPVAVGSSCSASALFPLMNLWLHSFVPLHMPFVVGRDELSMFTSTADRDRTPSLDTSTPGTMLN
ncbi:hypothetical protein INR49_011601 [Caranx melampygus]|nr:hypothetical protein INR49_011601 [Caranx melampygus]